MNHYDQYLAANQKLDDLIDLNPTHDRSLAAIQGRAVERLERMAGFLRFLGDPHRAVPVIHVGGTSGKGSTATAIASILSAAGYTTLLHTSPYLQVATEKLQIQDRLIDASLYADLIVEVMSAAARYSDVPLTYGEAWMALVGMAMAHVQPDVAIIEVGAGGRFDLTNVVEPSVAVITTVGIDHTETLGGSIPEIAWHKAGIIKPGAAIVHSVGEPAARSEIDRQIATSGAGLVAVINTRELQIERDGGGHATWLDHQTGMRLRAGVPGTPQAQNGAVAVAAVRAFDRTVTLDAIEKGLRQSRIAARCERMPHPSTVVLDGAHSVQKMEALLADLETLPRPRVAVIGFLAAKQSDEMIKLLGSRIDHVVVTRPDIPGKIGREVTHTAESVRKHTSAPVVEAASPSSAVHMAESIAGKRGAVIVTGSLYLCGAVRERWYPAREIVERLTQWPEIAPRPS